MSISFRGSKIGDKNGIYRLSCLWRPIQVILGYCTVCKIKTNLFLITFFLEESPHLGKKSFCTRTCAKWLDLGGKLLELVDNPRFFCGLLLVLCERRGNNLWTNIDSKKF
jgi:hypothetical protein